jgi:hypothetical protein
LLLKRLLELEASLGKNQKNNRMTRAEAQAFKDRWEVVNTAEKEELASTPMADKFRQLAALLTSAGKLGWTRDMEAEEPQVRDRWVRLRRVYHTRTGGSGAPVGGPGFDSYLK